MPLAGVESDLEYYVRECGEILGVARRLPLDKRSGKHILEYIFTQLIEFKKSCQVCECVSRMSTRFAKLIWLPNAS